jgi:hypothetical protein
MNYMQFLLPYVKVNTTSDIPGNLPSPGEHECDYGEIQEKECNDFNVVESATEQNKRQTFSELQRGMAADDTSSWVKKRKTSSASSDVDKSFMEFVNMKKHRFASDNDHRKQFLLSLLPDVKEVTDNQMRRFKRKVLELVEDFWMMVRLTVLPPHILPYQTAVLHHLMDPVQQYNNLLHPATSAQTSHSTQFNISIQHIGSLYLIPTVNTSFK